MELKIASLENEDIQTIVQFEKQKYITQGVSDIEISMIQWNSKWRPEYIEHYWKTGWSFTVKNSANQLVGYFLAQPFMFFNGQTQTLWVDVISSEHREVLELMIDTFVKLCREKHLQMVYIPKEFLEQNSENSFKGLEKVQTNNQNLYFIKTTKG